MATSTAAAVSCLLLLATLSIAAAEIGHPQAPAAAAGAVGGRTEISDVGKNKLVQSLGRFAVAEHNRRLGHGGSGNNGDPVQVQLAFTAVAAAQKQVISGVVYYLKVIARAPAGGGGDRPFDAVVVVKAWAKSKELVSFMPSPK
ncbi:cystatin Hv-CPI9 [Hordeum vulgare]|uniref:Predicted protein n=2 Tax=Hordeum vulgare TaxID=4513 RepID=F2D9M6_HORVV|nr:cysteine proteinase inhibitor 10-like [Hordeum vulgare subsp. vulgare]KAE8805065.1 cystatin Hv-CPI9 [Hordeum vulgare]BAJ91797.1 predicted protein [Hordeum vulgare subsp. vulgare]CAG38125.1 cystatin Hv-CPI9 [Hordeum vulgare subsp. vulgare]